MCQTIGCFCLAIVGIIIAAIMAIYSLGSDAYHFIKKKITDETEVASVKTVNDSVNISISTNKVVETVDVQPIDNHFQVQESGNYVDTMLTISAGNDNEEIEAFELFFDKDKTDLTEEDIALISELTKYFIEVNRPKMILLRQYIGREEDFPYLKGKLDLVNAEFCKAGIDETLIQQDAPDQVSLSGNGKIFIQVNVLAK